MTTNEIVAALDEEINFLERAKALLRPRHRLPRRGYRIAACTASICSSSANISRISSASLDSGRGGVSGSDSRANSSVSSI